MTAKLLGPDRLPGVLYGLSLLDPDATDRIRQHIAALDINARAELAAKDAEIARLTDRVNELEWAYSDIGRERDEARFDLDAARAVAPTLPASAPIGWMVGVEDGVILEFHRDREAAARKVVRCKPSWPDARLVAVVADPPAAAPEDQR